jgi:hypothetical protein
MPKVLKVSSSWTVPEGAVYVGRDSRLGDPKYGNPFKSGVDGTREEVIQMFEEYLKGSPTLLEDVRKNLRGRDLACHCFPLPCHADVLLKLANPPTIEHHPL